MTSWRDPDDRQERPTDVDDAAKEYQRLEDDRDSELDERDRLEERL